MHRKKIRIVSFILAVITLLGSVSFAADSASDSVNIKSVVTADISYGPAAVTKTYTGSYDGKTAVMESIEFMPDAGMLPMVTNGGSVMNAATLTTQLNQASGLTEGTVVGGVNGGFYLTSYGLAEGMQIQNGKLLSTNNYTHDNSGSKFYSIGFTDVGDFIYGIPKFDITIACGGCSATAGALNQLPRSTYGIWVLNSDYGSYAKWDTAYNNTYYVLTLKKTAGNYQVNGTVTGSFVSYKSYNAGSAKQCTLSRDYIYLLGPKSEIEPLATAAKKNTLNVTFNETTGNWSNAYNALRGGDLLIKNGTVQYNLDSSIMGLYTARTVAGVKADGSVGFFVFDSKGRQSSNYVNGLPLVSVARTLKNLGYVTAVNLDGGGSSTIAVRKTPTGGLSVLNSPSDGGQRAVGNGLAFISFVRPGTLINNFETMNITLNRVNEAGGKLVLASKQGEEYAGISCAKLTYDFNKASSGASLILTLKETALPSNAAGLSVWMKGTAGTKVRAVYANASGENVESPVVRLSGDGYNEYTFAVLSSAVKLRGIKVESGSSKTGTVYFDQLRLHNYLKNTDTLAPKISVSSKSAKATAGTVLKMSVTDDTWGEGVDKNSAVIYINNQYQANGTSFTIKKAPSQMLSKVTYEAADIAGNRTRAYGLIAKSEYKADAYFADVSSGHWASDSINYCYLRGILEGTKQGSKRYYNGNQNMTRAEFCATLVRMKKVDLSKYASVKLPYADVNQIPKWALSYVKAAYALGIMKGSKEGDKLYFKANANISRAEAAVAVESLLPTAEGFAVTGRYTDQSKIPSWATSQVNRSTAYGIFAGNEKGAFCPSNAITRNEVAMVLARLYPN